MWICQASSSEDRADLAPCKPSRGTRKLGKEKNKQVRWTGITLKVKKAATNTSLERNTRIESLYKDHEESWELHKQRLGLSRQWENQQGRNN